MIDASTFATLFDTLYPRVFGYIRARVYTMESAEDLTATVFEKALRYRHSYAAGKGNLDAWVFQIARNTVIDYYRASKRIPDQTELDEAAQHPTEALTPEQETLKKELQVELYEIMRQLSDRDQEIIQLRFFGRLTNRKIAEILDMNEKSVSVIIFRALKKMKQQLEVSEAV